MKNLFNIIFLLLIFNALGYSTMLNKTYYCFDAGGDNSKIINGAIQLDIMNTFSDDNGYGWTVSPDKSFEREKLSNSRDAFDIDGVIAKNIGFKANLPNGRWWVTLFMESGLEDSATTKIKLNGDFQNPQWQTFRPNAEGRKNWSDAYRVFHRPVIISHNELMLEVLGVQDSVRIMGIKLYPDPQPASETDKQLLDQIRSAGKFASAIPLDSLNAGLPELIDKLKLVIDKDQDNAFSRYWYDQLSILYKAENYIKMMGWEWETERTGLNIFDRYTAAVMLLDGLLDQPDPENNPIYERALWQRSRVLFWLDMERHGKYERQTAIRDLSLLFSMYSDNKLLAMYNGQKIVTTIDDIEISNNAPQWSALQYKVLSYLRTITYWWVLERQAENGEFGGKLGDDVELLRAFPPLVLSGDTCTFKGWKKLADRVWQSDQIYKGYARIASDVEHASELVSDVAPEMVMYTDDQEYAKRLEWSADYFRDLWTGKTKSGSRYFKSSWFSSTKVRTDPPRDRDVEMNSRAVKAVRYLAWKSRDAQVIETLYEWSLAWVKAALRTDKGKPLGIVPASIRFTDESINGDGPNWYNADMYWSYYNWSHNAGSMILDQLLFTYTLTHDEKLLQPLIETLTLIQKYREIDFGSIDTEPGSELWAVKILISKSGFWNVVEQWRLYTGDQRFDDLVLEYGTPFIRFRLTGEEQYLVQGLKSNLEKIKYNFPLLTSEVLHTDRVYLRGGSANLGTFHLNAMLTGSGLQTSPYNAISWENTNSMFTALVKETGKNTLSVDVFNHSKNKTNVTIRIWQLDPGEYNMFTVLDGIKYNDHIIKINKPGERIILEIPGEQLINYVFQSINKN